MAVNGVSSSAADIQADYMKLLVVQLQNQNPLNPADPVQFLSQLTEFSQLEQSMAMKTDLDKIVTTLSSAASSQTATGAAAKTSGS